MEPPYNLIYVKVILRTNDNGKCKLQNKLGTHKDTPYLVTMAELMKVSYEYFFKKMAAL